MTAPRATRALSALRMAARILAAIVIVPLAMVLVPQSRRDP